MGGSKSYWSRLSISSKLVLLMLSVVLGVAVASSTVLIISAYRISRDNFVPASVQAVSRIISEPIVLTPLLSNQHEAIHILREACEHSQISAIGIYGTDNQLYAGFTSPNIPPMPEVAPTESEQRGDVLTRVEVGPNAYVTISILADASLPLDFYVGMTIAVIIILVFILLFGSLATGIIHRVIARPVLHLIRIANTVSIEENYSVRAERFYRDEIGILAQTFNTMLSRIEARDQLLTSAKNRAEQANLQAQTLAVETRMSNQKLEQEISSRKRTERQLTRLQHHLNSIIDSMPSALVAVNEKLAVAQWNREASVLTGINHDEAMGKHLGEVMPFLVNTFEQVQDALDHETAAHLEKLVFTLPDGESHMDMMIYPLTDADQHGVVIRLDDISRRMQLEEMMVQTEKMMSVGGLAAGMAHEINNPLGAILQNTQNINRRISIALPANHKLANQLRLDLEAMNNYLSERGIHRFLDAIQSAGVRASHIVSNMLQFSRRESRDLMPTAIDELITRTLEIAASDFNLAQGFDFMRITIQKEIDPDLPPVACITNQIQQVLLNLLKNAAQAINKRENSREPGQITITAHHAEGQVIITIKDNGTGMPEEVRRRIFEPFYTTKEIGSGTGLGLSVSYFIITNNHHGTISVSSTPDAGTIFTIKLNVMPIRQKEI